MSYVNVWIHAVWGTKNRAPVLVEDVRQRVIDHIHENARAKGIYVERLNGYTEHLHCLFALNADMSVATSLQLLKGESAHWANQEKITDVKFEWANEYYASSVSEADLQRVSTYIELQAEHHRKKSFKEEVEGFLQRTDLVRLG